jgi:hypothetical protein
MIIRAVWVQALVLLITSNVAMAQGVANPPASPSGKAAKVRRAPLKPVEKGAEAQALPCPRATYKDDPVCFGERDKDALPLPSSTSVPHQSTPDGLKVKPTANLNPRPTGPGPYQAGVVYQSNGNAVTSNYGGGVKLELPL